MKTFVYPFLLLAFLMTLGACSGIKRPQSADSTLSLAHKKGQKPTASPASHKTQEKTMELSGTLSVRGGGKMAHLQLNTPRRSYWIDNPEAFGLQQMQNRRVVVKARLIQKAIGPGFPAKIEVLSLIEAL